jgi:chemotaxis protein methyltransferase CheR
MNSFLAEKPVYKKHDLVKDGNIFYVKFDLIICRNVIIYFNYELQNKVFEIFYNNLYNNGYLWLGMHESILGPYASKLEKSGHFYQKKENPFYPTP